MGLRRNVWCVEFGDECAECERKKGVDYAPDASMRKQINWE
jgi:hypothetical protein